MSTDSSSSNRPTAGSPTGSTGPTAPTGATATNAAANGAAGPSLKDSLNLPKTTFAMKANLVQSEPASLKRWSEFGGKGLYAALRARENDPATASPKGRFVFHDGPPYANGSIHVGHLFNKCLKDFVVRTRTMMGYDVPYVPGWDCHGLPIEHKVVTEMHEKGKDKKLAELAPGQRAMIVRRECQAYAEKWVKSQGTQMQRLMTMADYQNPYLTMKPEFEGATLEVLSSLLEAGLVFRALKPVHWSIANQTALAEAELEYEDRVDLSVYVDFEAEDGEAVYAAFGLAEEVESEEEEVEEGDEGEEGGADESQADVGQADQSKADGPKSHAPKVGTRPGTRPCFMIWTTTPWTLPANLAIAVNPKFEYALIWVDGNVTVLATELAEKVMQLARAEEVVILGRASGQKLLGLKYRHPFVQPAKNEGVFAADGRFGDTSKVYSVMAADYVTLEDGTGLVHTAPGHGTEDYQTGLREGLPVYCPVRADGTYDDTVSPWLRGKDVWTANAMVAEHLRSQGHLFFDQKFSHSYPHDWRSKTPTIFRCTEQWFVGVDKASNGATALGTASLRQAALAAVNGDNVTATAVKFVPEWGRNRMRGMLDSRPDWCISRQRSWGLPIPAFFRPDGSVFMTAATVRAMAKLVREKGSDVWFNATPAELLAYYDAAKDPQALPGDGAAIGTLVKGGDILDVWFESGSTWNAVMRERSGGKDFPMDLYLEGSDQHRGWFQTSLLPSLGMMGRAPYKTLLTHGFIVDKDGRKMSKSLGNTLDVDDLLKEYGADVCRWWVSSMVFENDVKMDKSFFDVAGESYRKVRNTMRFLLSNLYDFGKTDMVAVGDLPATGIDAWILAEFDRATADVTASYNAYDFRRAHSRIFDLCNESLSAVYLAAVKDRLYCDGPGSKRRRATQTVMWHIADGLCKLLAPVMPHTADEAYRALHQASAGSDRCVHMQRFNAPTGVVADARWERVVALRSAALVVMERSKAAMGVDSPMEMGVALPNADGLLNGFAAGDLADLLGVSRVTIGGVDGPVVADLRGEPLCERSRKRDGTVRARASHGGVLLSDRDAAAVGAG